MTEQHGGITPTLWILMAVVIGILLVLLVAMVLGSLWYSVLLASTATLAIVSVWQRKHTLRAWTWFANHPNTAATLRVIGKLAVTLFHAMISLFRHIWRMTATLFSRLTERAHVPRVTAREQKDYSKDDLDRWKAAETRDVTHPRDPRTKYCLGNIGTTILILYRGHEKIIRPLRVFSKPQFRKTYVHAEEEGELKTFNIEHMEIPGL